MSRVVYLVNLFLYKSLFSRLPPSSTFLGKVTCAKKLRYVTTKRIIKSIGLNCTIEKNATFTRDTALGDNSGLGINCSLGKGVYIGKNVLMGPNVTIHTRNHRFDRRDVPIIEQGYSEVQEVRIMDDVWIGGNVTILPGVTIHEGSIVGTGAVVTRDVQAYSIVGGVPAKKIRDRFL